jgi:ubiquinone/menaquinone biosynthesis C-methylase UbiE
MNLTKEMIQVYEEYAQLSDDSEVMALVNNTPIERKVEAFNLYKDYLQGKSRFLDWGCKDGHVGYMVNSLLPEKVEIHGCDIRKGKYSIFSEKANLEYSQLKHHYKLPYEDNYFDVVIGNGVLEHVANDSESIKELYRIIKPDGYLVITFLPNFWSYTEFISRMIKKMLLHKGFISVNSGYHQVVPSLVSLSKIKQVRFLYPILNQIYKVNKYLDKLPLINKIAANIYVICQKKSAL